MFLERKNKFQAQNYDFQKLEFLMKRQSAKGNFSDNLGNSILRLFGYFTKFFI